MFETADEIIQLAISLGTLAGIVIVGLTFIYKRGKQAGLDKACGERIEEKVDALQETVGKKVSDSDNTHSDLYTKLDNTNQKINKVEKDVSYIKGRMDEVHPKK